jgi:hypothetical protein
MSFDPNPMSMADRKREQLAHAQNMLNIVNSLGSYSESPLPKFNYGGQAQQLNTDINRDFAATLLMASGGGNGNFRTKALHRRLKKK